MKSYLRLRNQLQPLIKNVISRISAFIHEEQSAGAVMLVCTIVSLILANTAAYPFCQHFWEGELFKIFDWAPAHLVNDGLMAVFFLLVGMEIKKEIISGGLSDMRSASLPLIGALGGMLCPALIFAGCNMGRSTIDGWGIPMATDIAFALAVMAALGSRVPTALRLLLTTLAVADDLGAIVVIACFYSSGLMWSYVGAAMALIGILIWMNRSGVKSVSVYALTGLILWYCVYRSGIHSTIAGVILAMVIPYDRGADRNSLERLETLIHLPVHFVVLPLFALCNTLIHFEGNLAAVIQEPLAWGIVAGLVLGKTAGIFGFSRMAVGMGISSLPEGIGWRHILGMSMLGGIGFTMSIFVAMLAFGDVHNVLISKIAILGGSVIAAIIGMSILGSIHQKTS